MTRKGGGRAEGLSLASNRDSIYKNLPDAKAVSLLQGRMEKRSPARGNLLVPTPAWSHPGSPAGSSPSRQPPGGADSGSLLATTLLLGPLALECAKQLKCGILIVVLSSGGTFLCLEGCSSSVSACV